MHDAVIERRVKIVAILAEELVDKFVVHEHTRPESFDAGRVRLARILDDREGAECRQLPPDGGQLLEGSLAQTKRWIDERSARGEVPGLDETKTHPCPLLGH